MRRFTRCSVLVLGTGALAFGVLAPGAGAGIREGAAPLTVVKTVTGPVAPGTTFTATVSCVPDIQEAETSGIIDDGTEEGADVTTVTFGADGQPTSPDTVTFDGPGVCTITETANGGATSTTYSCVGSASEDDGELEPVDGVDAFQLAPDDPVCPSAGPQSTPITVNIVNPGQTATVTIANTFVAQQAQPAAQIVAQPAFTG